MVEGFDKTWVFLNDPASGRRQVSWEEFDRSFTGVALEIRPGPEFTKGGRKPSMFLSLFDRLRGSFGAILYLICAGFLLVVPGLALPVFSQIFVDRILLENMTDWLRPLLLGDRDPVARDNHPTATALFTQIKSEVSGGNVGRLLSARTKFARPVLRPKVCRGN